MSRSIMRPGRRVSNAKMRENSRNQSVPVRTAAVFLAAALVFSVLFSHIPSIVRLLTVRANPYTNGYIDAETYYDAGLTLYDYIDDNNTPAKNGQVFHKFNTVLYSTSYIGSFAESKRTYAKNATYTKEMNPGDGTEVTGYLTREYGTGTDGNGYARLNSLLQTAQFPSVYYPLYLGLQYQGGSPDPKVYLQDSNGALSGDLGSDPTKYNYNLSANSNAGSTNSVAQNLVNSQLTGGLVTQGSGDSLVTLPYFDKDFLTTLRTINVAGSNKSYQPGYVYEGKTFRFRKHTSGSYNGYYVYDSRYDGLVRDINTSDFNQTNSYTVVTHGTPAQVQAATDGKYERYADETSDTSYGFFPLGQYNFGFGAKFDINFTMTEDGKNPVTGQDMVFNFSGDDDVWVFIDDHLVLDIGGAHGRVGGSINFAKALAKVDKVKQPSNLEYAKAYDDASGFIENKSGDLSTLFNNTLNLYDDPTKTHTLRVFYMERGRNNSNCMITFNFEQADTLTVENHINYENVNGAFLEKTAAVAEAEGIEYLLRNNGADTGQTSPDDGVTDLNVELRKEISSSSVGTYNIHYMVPGTAGYFTTANASSVTWNEWKVVQYNKDRVQRLRFDAVRSPKWDLRGWTTEKKGDDYTGSHINTYFVDDSSGVTDVYLYAVWDYVPLIEGNLPVPLVVVFRRGENTNNRCVYEGSIYSDGDVQITQNGSYTRNPFKKVSETIDGGYGTWWYFANYTAKVNAAEQDQTWNNWWKVRWGNDQSNNNNTGDQIPFENGWNDYSGDRGNASDKNMKLKSGWMYLLDITENVNRSCKFRYDVNSADWIGGGTSDLTNHLPLFHNDIRIWFKNYQLLYHDLSTFSGSGLETRIRNMSNAERMQFESDITTWINEYKYGYMPYGSETGLTTVRMAEIRRQLTGDSTIQPITTAAMPPVIYPMDEPQDNTAEWPDETGDPPADRDQGMGNDTPDADDHGQTEDDPAGDTQQGRNGPASGSGEGHWAGSSDGTYQNVANTNFRYKWTEGTHSVVRQTTGNGKFYLSGDHSGKFTVQFARASNLRLWQTGNSYIFSQPQNRLETATGSAQRAGYDSSVDKSSLLAKRYATEWMMYDNSARNPDGTVNMDETHQTDPEAGYTAWTTAGNNTPSTGAGSYSFLMDFVNATANPNAFVDVYVVYTNTVLTGNISHRKTVTDTEAAANPDAEYEFLVTFSHVFGGNSGNEDNYEGDYKLYDENGQQIDGSGDASTAALSTDNGRIKLKAGWKFVIEGVPVMTQYTITEQLPDGSTTFVKSASVADISVDGLTASGTVNSGDYNESGDIYVTFKPNRAGVLSLDSVGGATQYYLNGSETASAIPGDKKITVASTDSVAVIIPNGTDYSVSFLPSGEGSDVNWTVYESIYKSNVEYLSVNNTALSGQVRADVKGNDAWSSSHSVTSLEDGTQYKNYVPYSARNDVFGSTLENDILRAMIIIRKQIDKRYYYTEAYTGTPSDTQEENSDNPAGLYGTSHTVGGQGPDIAGNDANAYQKATNAVQTFIYRIDEYRPGSTSGTYQDSPSCTFYETISFDSSDDLGVFKYRIIDADPSCKYKITEQGDWSWKYKPDEADAKKTAVLPDVTGNTARSNDSGHDPLEVIITKYGIVTTPMLDKNGKIVSYTAVTYSNSAMATYYNTKDVADKDVEGDTYITENIATKAS